MMKKGIIAIAVILIAAGIICFVYPLITSNFDLSMLGTAKYETNTYTISQEFDHIEIHSVETDILLAPAADNKVSIVCMERDKVRHQVTVEKGTLMITADDQRDWMDRLTFFTKSLTMTVYLPAESYQSLTIDSRTGKVTVPSSFSFGSIDITSGTGKIICSASADGAFKAKAGTGDIVLNGVKAKSFDLSATTGDIEVISATCADHITITVSTGKIKLTDTLCKSLHVSGSTGRMTLGNTVASDDFDLTMSTGDVFFENCDAGSITVNTTTGDVRGSLRSAKVFIAKASTGKISVPDTVTGGKCEITTTTGDIEISLVQ